LPPEHTETPPASGGARRRDGSRGRRAPLRGGSAPVESRDGSGSRVSLAGRRGSASAGSRGGERPRPRGVRFGVAAPGAPRAIRLPRRSGRGVPRGLVVAAPGPAVRALGAGTHDG